MTPNNHSVKETTRIEAFSDGVFAIAITLLVLNIQVPHSTDLKGSLLAELGNHWASYLAFFIGFFSILVCLINHHHICNYILRCDNNMQTLNNLILLVVIVVPFSTSLLAEYINQAEQQTAIAIYGITYCFMALVYDLMWNYAYKYKFTNFDVDDKFLRAIKRIYDIEIFYTLFAFAVSFVSVIAGLVLYTLMFIIYFFPEHFTKRLMKISNNKNNFNGKQKRTLGKSLCN
jgi:uncharacterized membrane protein